MLFSKAAPYKRILLIASGILLLIFIVIIFLVNIFLEPTLRNKLHTLIIEGSDSLYTYDLGRLKANFFGGDVEVQNLHIDIDSNHYKALEEKNELPALTMQLSLQNGHIKGVGLVSILFGKKINIEEIMTRQANIRLSRHIRKNETAKDHPPLWKAIQPAIKAISIKHIKLDGVKLLYKNADTSESVKLQFDRFDAAVDDIQIDSTAAYDTARIAFAKSIFLKFHDVKFRTQDSSYKMKAEWLTYASKSKTIEMDSFKLQPTLKKAEFYKYYGVQASLYYVELNKIRFINTHIDHFIKNNIIDADTVLLQQPKFSVYLDKTQERLFKSKIGSFPHQKLLQSQSTIRIKNIIVKNASVEYTEKNAGTGQEGTLGLQGLNIAVKNATNDSDWIRQNSICTVRANGKILGNSPITASFKFYLDSTNGRFDAEGSIRNVAAAQLNNLSVPLANTQIPSLDLHSLNFKVHAEDFTAWANVKMRYNNLSVVLRKTDEETGTTTTRKFITKLLNRYVIRPDNPGADGIEITANNVRYSRLTTQSFFGLIWKAIFAGMQSIMMRSG